MRNQGGFFGIAQYTSCEQSSASYLSGDKPVFAEYRSKKNIRRGKF